VATPDLLKISEVANQLGVSPESVRRYVRKGELAAIILPSKHRRFRREDVEAFLDRAAS
jgi:excisionase family DNA binding protein